MYPLKISGIANLGAEFEGAAASWAVQGECSPQTRGSNGSTIPAAFKIGETGNIQLLNVGLFLFYHIRYCWYIMLQRVMCV